MKKSIKRKSKADEQTVLSNNRMEAKRLAGSCTSEIETKKTGIFSVEKQKESPRQDRLAHSG